MSGARSRTVRSAGVAALCLAAAWPCVAAPLKILAAESAYGQVASAIAGNRATITSILTNPGQDPHDFEARPSTARLVAEAAIVAVNGAGYDTWMDHLLTAAPMRGRDTIVVATLVQAAPGANPHLWYNPLAMPRFAEALTAALCRHDPAGATAYSQNLKIFLAGTAVLQTRIAALRGRFAGTPITATEPVFDDMAAALGLQMRNERFQRAIMNGTEPRASDVAAMDADLREHRVRVLLTNPQVTDAATARLLGIARESGIPLVPVMETLPPGQTYVGWMLAQLAVLETALAAK